jgi:hypothetical protein
MYYSNTENWGLNGRIEYNGKLISRIGMYVPVEMNIWRKKIAGKTKEEMTVFFYLNIN